MVVKNTHTPAAAAMQACVTHSTCVADFVLYTSAPDGGKKNMQMALVHVCSGKTFPTCFIYWPTLEPMNELTPLKTSSQSSLNKDSYSWFCFCGWLHLSFWSLLYQQAFTSALILQPSLLTDAGLNDSCWVFVFVSCGRLWRCQWWGGSVWEFLMFNLLLQLFGIKGQLMTPTLSFQFPFVDLLTQHFSTARASTPHRAPSVLLLIRHRDFSPLIEMLTSVFLVSDNRKVNDNLMLI